MSFLVYDLTFLAIFVIALVLLFIIKRKNFKWEGILLLYRTKIGLDFIDKTSKKYRGLIGKSRYLVIIVGYLLMISMLYLLFQLLYVFLKRPDIVREIKIPPLTPLIPYLPSIFKLDFLPPFYFTYWIIAIACIALFHEFAHGIFAKYAGVKVKSTGFGFLGPFLAAFVVPDEKQMQKKSKLDQLAILGAGTFANSVITVLTFILLVLFFLVAFKASGFIFNSYTYSYVNASGITSINNMSANSFIPGNNTILNITVDNRTFVVNASNISAYINNGLIIRAYQDSPALRLGITGAIVKINDYKIESLSDMSNAMKNFKPGDNITLKVFNGSSNVDYNITLARSYENSSLPLIGVGFLKSQRAGLSGKFYSLISSFKKPEVYYTPRFDGDFVVFIYNLIWWLVIINFSVALVNMLPLALFDGGRFFYLTVFAIIKREKVAKYAFTFATYLILLIFVLLMVFWGLAFM